MNIFERFHKVNDHQRHLWGTVCHCCLSRYQYTCVQLSQMLITRLRTQLRCKTCSLFVINPLSISIPRPNNAMTSSSSLTILPHICPASTHFNEYNIIKLNYQNIIETKPAKGKPLQQLSLSVLCFIGGYLQLEVGIIWELSDNLFLIGQRG